MKAATKSTAVDIAAQRVAAAFAELIGQLPQSDEIDDWRGDAISEVVTILRRDFEAEYGPIDDDDDRDGNHETIGREAGYIVGVQVGLRLRGGA
jgi:hypothetical protein